MPDEVRLRTLMVSYQAGDLTAFDQLYALLAPPIQGFLLRQLHDAERVDDLVQETFLQIHRARHTYNPEYPPLPWALAIARHVWLMQRRAAGRRPHATVDVENVGLTTRASAEAYAASMQLRTALRAVPPERRRPLLWHHVWGFSFKEIAHRLGIRPEAAKLRSSRGMADLRHRLSTLDAPEKADDRE